jgi:hypothetical protein
MESKMVDSAPLFADGGIFFARSDDRSVQALKDTLKTSCDGSGQKANLDKSSVFFGNHYNEMIKNKVKGSLGVQSEIQAIPTFVMSCFQIPVANCDKMRSIVATLWWSIEEGKRKLHWRSWEWLSAPETLGGMGFRDIALFN